MLLIGCTSVFSVFFGYFSYSIVCFDIFADSVMIDIFLTPIVTKLF